MSQNHPRSAYFGHRTVKRSHQRLDCNFGKWTLPISASACAVCTQYARSARTSPKALIFQCPITQEVSITKGLVCKARFCALLFFLDGCCPLSGTRASLMLWIYLPRFVQTVVTGGGRGTVTEVSKHGPPDLHANPRLCTPLLTHPCTVFFIILRRGEARGTTGAVHGERSMAFAQCVYRGNVLFGTFEPVEPGGGGRFIAPYPSSNASLSLPLSNRRLSVTARVQCTGRGV